MSVVAAVYNKYGILMMGDTKATSLIASSKDKIMNKVIKDGNKLLGFTGDVTDIYKFLFPIVTKDLRFSDYKMSEGYFLRLIDAKYYEEAIMNRHYNIQFMAAEKIGSVYFLNIYSLFEFEKHSYAMTDMECTFLGVHDEEHKENFTNIYNCSSVKNIIESFQRTLDLGVKFDNTINNKMHYEYIGDLYMYGK